MPEVTGKELPTEEKADGGNGQSLCFCARWTLVGKQIARGRPLSLGTGVARDTLRFTLHHLARSGASLPHGLHEYKNL